jgi:hypothetical protein
MASQMHVVSFMTNVKSADGNFSALVRIDPPVDLEPRHPLPSKKAHQLEDVWRAVPAIKERT